MQQKSQDKITQPVKEKIKEKKKKREARVCVRHSLIDPREYKTMPRTSFAGAFSSPRVDVAIDTGNPLLNLTVDGFLKIGAVAVTRSVAEDVFHVVKKGSIKSSDFEHSLKKMCKECAYWGSIAGLYVGMEYGAERIRGSRDWKNAMIGGALTGAIVSAVSNQNKDKIAIDAITGGAIATASVFINYLT